MIRLENISKYYHSGQSVTCALNNINLEFNIGEFVAITGESGSGKTTLLNVMSGLDTYEDGEMFYNEKATSYFDNNDWEKYRKDNIAFIFQNYNLIDSFTVLENAIIPFIIDGYTKKEAVVQAEKLLKLVGLDNHLKTKAIKLSGGQKQRLAIARALAKNTNIIVADEPTGNLDVENGNNIMSLLKNISKNKLVIIVTHNQLQADPYITRKIRLHDGKIVFDEKLNSINTKINEIDLNIKKNKAQNLFNKVKNFSFLNIKSQPKKSILIFSLMLVTILSCFVFLGTFSMNIDDSNTKKLSDEIFLNHDNTRLLVKTNNNDDITDDIINKAIVNNVNSFEKYDYITDINYFRPSDYKKIYSGGWVENGLDSEVLIDSSSISFVDYSHYMRSCSSITKDMLICGELPNDSLEMVIFSDDLTLLNTKEIVYFQNTNKWGVNTAYKYEVTISGILKNETKQTYFSDDICKILDLTKYSLQIIIPYAYFENYNHKKIINMNYVCVDYRLINDEISFPKIQYDGLKDLKELSNNNSNVTYSSNVGTYYSGLCTYDFGEMQTISDNAIGVSAEKFEKIYEYFNENKQFALFIEDYAYMDDVINSLENEGFIAISCIRASVTGYNSTKVNQRYFTLILSISSIFIICLIEIFLNSTILKLKKKDYLIYKIIGLSNKESNYVNIFELFFYSIISFILVILVSLIAKNVLKTEYIINFFKYIRFYHYIILFLISIIITILTGLKFKKFLFNRINIMQLKED